MQSYIINGREILKKRGMLFVDWCKINNFDYLVDELDWDFVEEEYGLDKYTLTQGFNKKCRWVCHKCGAVMNFKVVHRTNGHWNCSYCDGNRLDLRYHSVKDDLKDIMDEWDYDLNKVDPKTISSSSRNKYHWICPEGHLYESSPIHRKEGKGCPICAGLKTEVGVNDLATTNPELVEEWDFDNNEITPYEITRGNDRFYINWICPKGHKYSAKCVNRTANKTGCPYCANKYSSSFPETAIFYYLDKYFYNIYRRVKIDGFEFDIYMPDEKILIEYNGYKWHSNPEVQKRDLYKKELARIKGYRLIIINSDRSKTVNTDIKRYSNIVEITMYCEKANLYSVDTMLKNVFNETSKLLGITLDNNIVHSEKDFSEIETLLTNTVGYMTKEA